LELFLVPFLDHFLATFGGRFGVIFEAKTTSKSRPFFARFLLGLGRHFERLPGLLGARLGRSVFPKCCKKQYETMIFKLVLFRSGSSLGGLLEPILAHFGEVLDAKMPPKVAQKVTRNWSQKYTTKCITFGHQNGAMDCLIFSYFLGSQPKMAPRGPKTSLRRPKMAPRGPQDDPRWPQDGPKTTQDGPKTAQDSPKTAQNGRKRAQEGSRRLQDCFEKASIRPQDGLRWPQDGPRRLQHGPRPLQDGPRRPKTTPRLLQNSPRTAQDGPKTSQDSCKW
jgi:hypothetical protein